VTRSTIAPSDAANVEVGYFGPVGAKKFGLTPRLRPGVESRGSNCR
jgi:hypothetical protein